MYRKVISVMIVLIFLVSFMGTAICEESETTKYIKYQAEKKEPWVAVLGAWFCPSLGHWYAGNWPRGIPFLVGDIAAIAVMVGSIRYEEDIVATIDSGQYNTAFLALLVLRIWEYFDAYAVTEEYNKNLMKKYGIEVSLRDAKPVLQLSHSF